MPFLVPDAETGSAVFWKVYEKFLKNEHKDTKVLWVFCHGAGQVFTTKKSVKTLEDFTGMKIRSPGKIMSDVLQQFGASAIGMPITQVYTGLERGLLDGLIAPWETMRPFRFYEKAKYATVADLYSLTFFVTMNKKKYDSLPMNLQQAIDDHSGEKMAIKAGKAYDDSDGPGKTLAVSKGMIEYTLPAAEREKWKKTANIVVDKWLADMKSKNLPGQKVLDYAKFELKKAVE